MSQPAGFTALHADAVRALAEWAAPDAAQEQRCEEFLDVLLAHPDALWREGPPEHLTASALVLNAEGSHVLLTLHRKARAWFQFGGHFEADDTDIHAAATREAREESGIATLELAPGIVELSSHALSGSFGRCRRHDDIRFAAIAPAGVRHAVSAESDDVRWWPVDALPSAAGADLPALIGAALRHLGLEPCRNRC